MKREKILKEIDFFGGKDFDKRKEVDLTDEGELAATLKLAQLSGYDIAIKEVCKEIDKRIESYRNNKLPKNNFTIEDRATSMVVLKELKEIIK